MVEKTGALQGHAPEMVGDAPLMHKGLATPPCPARGAASIDSDAIACPAQRPAVVRRASLTMSYYIHVRVYCNMYDDFNTPLARL